MNGKLIKSFLFSNQEIDPQYLTIVQYNCCAIFKILKHIIFNKTINHVTALISPWVPMYYSAAYSVS